MGTGLVPRRKSPKTDPTIGEEILLLEHALEDPLAVAETVDLHGLSPIVTTAGVEKSETRSPAPATRTTKARRPRARGPGDGLNGKVIAAAGAPAGILRTSRADRLDLGRREAPPGRGRAALEDPDLDGPKALQGAPGDGLGRVRPGEDDLAAAHGGREPVHAHGRAALRQLERPLAPAGRGADEGQSDEERPERLGHHRMKRRRSWLTRMSLRWSCT
ncbi:MAG: hypothetical protein MZU95_07190 [Desulfomicrobium escambiense]|nr:hypothetical protein [Desulfomicrobium escambiense]